MTTLYIDTNVIIDAIDNRKNEYGNNIGDSAAKLFSEAIGCKYYLIFSDWMFKELRKHIIPQQIEMLFKLAKKKTIKIEYSEDDWKKAKALSQEHLSDALHVILAEKAKADIIITSNIEHFKEIPTNISIKKPKWL